MALVCRELDLDAKHHPPKAMLAQVDMLKNELIDHETFAARADGYREKALAEAYGEYQRRLVAAGAMDFGALIMNTAVLPQAVPGGRAGLPATLPARAGGRVPGHQPRPVHTRQGTGRPRRRRR